jgi:hypothetical protein
MTLPAQSSTAPEMEGRCWGNLYHRHMRKRSHKVTACHERSETWEKNKEEEEEKSKYDEKEEEGQEKEEKRR